jgi:hypothetical protein
MMTLQSRPRYVVACFVSATAASACVVEANDSAIATTSAELADTTGIAAKGVITLNGAPVFPLILSLPPPLNGTTPSGGDALAEVAGAGINFLKTGNVTWTSSSALITTEQAWEDAAAAHGVHTWLNLGNLGHILTPGSSADGTLHTVVNTFKNHPGLGLWKGADEPWSGGFSASQVQYSYNTVKGLDPNHQYVLIQAPKPKLSTGYPDSTAVATLSPYDAATDIQGVDIYPVAFGVTNPDLHQVGAWTSTASHTVANASVIMALQICSSGSVGPAGAFVMPSALQERFMIYDAIINGARGLSFFGGNATTCFSGSDAAHGWNWTFWYSTLKSLIEEIGPSSALYPALLVPGTGLGLTVSGDSTTTVLSRQVGTSDIWVIATRRGASPATATVTVAGLPTTITTGTVYTENRNVTVTNGRFSDTLVQWGVHVYHFVR